MRRFAVLLLLLVLGAAALPAVQAQGYWYGWLWPENTNISEGNGKVGRFAVERAAIWGGLPDHSFRICFSGSATAEEDYTVSSNQGDISLSGGCFTDSFGNLPFSGSVRYRITGIPDGKSESTETIVVTLDNLPNTYYVVTASVRFRISD